MSDADGMIAVAGRARAFMRPEDVDAVLRYLAARQVPDGGFRGRVEGSDVYYTLFAVSCYLALEVAPPAGRIRCYLAALGDGAALDFVHQAAAARCAALLTPGLGGVQARAMLERVERQRTPNGGYRLQAGTGVDSVYGAFVAWLAYAQAGVGMPDAAGMVRSLERLRTADGGYANLQGQPGSTTPATAAAVLLLHWNGSPPDPASGDTLMACEDARGGFRASVDAPAADLLSTATALYALRCLGREPRDPDRLLGFVELLWDDDGGFRGQLADPVTDVEYTFYALLALGCLDGR